MSATIDALEEVDIIFAGGGTAACVVAGRLAKSNPALKILIIEGGPNNYNDPRITTPAYYASHILPGSKTALFYKALASHHLNGREAIVPAGGVLGGGSSINLMMYTRPSAIDYDAWNTPGWSAREMLDMSNKLETYHPTEPEVDQSKHGHDGPIHISDGGYRGKAENMFFAAVKEMNYENIVDLQDFEACGGFSRWLRYVSPAGKRQDVAHQYIHPLLESGERPNLYLLVKSKVVKVLFNNQSPPRAIGVECRTREITTSTSASTYSAIRTIKASKLLILSAGALSTPQILERSGVGNPEILEQLNIPVKVNLQGVGENYMDHSAVLSQYRSCLQKSDTLGEVLSKDFAEAVEQKDPMLGWNGIDICSKLRPPPSALASLRPAYQKDYNETFAAHPSKPLVFCMVSHKFFPPNATPFPTGQYIQIANYNAHPWSRGRIHITSATDILTGYAFEPCYLSHPSDIKTLLWAYKMSREIARRLPYYLGEEPLAHPRFPLGSKASLVDLSSEAELARYRVTGDIQYTVDDDVVIEDWIRSALMTTWHSCGTCAMKPREKGGVVDRYLNVYGTRGLKVVDLSMVPENVGANTANTAMAVGEMAAVIIARELGMEV